MSFDPLSALFELGKTAIEKIWPDPSKRAEELFKLEQLKQTGDLAKMQAEVSLMLGQIEINKTEAANSNLFVSGWRPSVGWVCSAALAYEYLVRPLLTTFGIVAAPIEVDTLNTLLFALLGVAGLRSIDKIKGVA